MAKVSVIVPSYNLGMYLGETLKSVKDQSFTDWECIVVDNGSTDNSVSVAQSFAEADARYLVKKLPLNEGVAAARNRGMALAKGQYLLFLDADDLIAPGYMQAAVEALDADPSLNLVYGKAERFGTQTRWDLPPFSMETMLASNCLYVSCFLRASQAVKFDPAFKTGYEDWDFWLSLFEALPQAPRVKPLPQVCFYYRTRRHSRNSGVTDEALATIRRTLWEKHKALYAKYFCDPRKTVEYRRLERSFQKASRWSLSWKLRLLYRKLFG